MNPCLWSTWWIFSDDPIPSWATFAELAAKAGPAAAAAEPLLTTIAAAIPATTATPPIPPNRPATAPEITGGDWLLHWLVQ